MKCPLIAPFVSSSPSSDDDELDAIQETREGAQAAQKGDFVTAMQKWRSLAEQGNAMAMLNMGLMYSTGQCGKQDNKEAATWFNRALKQEDIEVQFNFAFMLKTGTGVPQNSKHAGIWYHHLAKKGVAMAQLQTGENYKRGWGGFKENHKEAMRWYRKAAEQGIAEAQYALGNLLHAYDDDTENGKESLKWHRMSAEQGYAQAQQALGERYYKGEGVSKDIVYAFMWMSIAESNGCKVVMLSSKYIAQFMTTSQWEEAQTLAQECKKNNYRGFR